MRSTTAHVAASGTIKAINGIQGRISECLPDRNEKLKMTDMLDGRGGGAEEELLVGAF